MPSEEARDKGSRVKTPGTGAGIRNETQTLNPVFRRFRTNLKRANHDFQQHGCVRRHTTKM